MLRCGNGNGGAMDGARKQCVAMCRQPDVVYSAMPSEY